MIRKSGKVTAQSWGRHGPALRRKLAVVLALLLGAVSPVWAQAASTPDEFVAHVQRGEQLLQSEKPSAALSELNAAFAMQREPRVIYLQGLAQQRLGCAPEALLLLQRFLSASTGASCCTEERREADRRIVELRQLMESGAPVSGTTAWAAGGLVEPNPQPTGAERDAANADPTATPDEYTARVQRAKQLLKSGIPTEALAELNAAFALRQEPRVLYLLGFASQELGMKREAVLFFQRFLVAAAGACCADEQAYARRRITKLRLLSGPFDFSAACTVRSADQPTTPSPEIESTPDNGASLLVAGGIMSVIGAGMIAGSIALFSHGSSCSVSSSAGRGCDNISSGVLLSGLGGAHLVIGPILLGVGLHRRGQRRK